MTVDEIEVDNADVIEELEGILRSQGVRVTRQRMVILAVLARTHDHPTVEELHERAKKFNVNVSLATVYRTIAVLEERGAIIRNEFEGTNARYEIANRPHHDHLIDVDSGQVIEFYSEEIEALQEKIAKELGYDIVYHRLELYVKKRDA